MAYFDVCEHCGATLDPGEKCTCDKDIEDYKNKMAELTATDGGGQLYLKVG